MCSKTTWKSCCFLVLPPLMCHRRERPSGLPAAPIESSADRRDHRMVDQAGSKQPASRTARVSTGSSSCLCRHLNKALVLELANASTSSATFTSSTLDTVAPAGPISPVGHGLAACQRPLSVGLHHRAANRSRASGQVIERRLLSRREGRTTQSSVTTTGLRALVPSRLRGQLRGGQKSQRYGAGSILRAANQPFVE